jgi:hypothetical protein
MIALARERVPAGTFRVESLLTTELSGCIGVASTGECFNYLFDGGNSPSSLVKLLRRIHRALQPGGLLLFDIAGPGRVPGESPRRMFAEGEDWAVLVSIEEDRRRRVLTRRITSFRRVGDRYRRDQETHRQRLILPTALCATLRTIGFRVKILRRYGTTEFPPGLAGFLARKP